MEIRALIDEKHFPLWGILGSITGIVMILTPMIPYVGTEGESFSIFRHYVSYLGHIGVSEFAWMFNIGMMVTGLIFVPFMIGLGMYLDNVISKIAGLVGVYTSVSIFFVGVFPMNYPEHGPAAMSFFLSGLVMSVLWTLTILAQKEVRVPKILSLGGIINIFFFAAFLYWPYEQVPVLSPPLSLVPTLEWGIYFAIVGYLLILALYVWKNHQSTMEKE
ncbi:MAG: DUF998 domain-containing protein [Candidatus Thorarchaeota archaeon]|nr:DUF998 domain-containing protein [Candidatus Thorarchaeota archaeon]